MATTVTDALVGQLVDGRYLVTSRIARGGMATVYLATDRRLDREIALKVMHPHLADGASGADFVHRFRREARAAAALTHPGLVGIYDQGFDGEISYLTMEYVDGTNLRLLLREAAPFTVGHALDVVEEVLDALAAAHRKGLVHRDIKPENILLTSDNRVKVTDFGLARAVTEVTSTATGTILGTVAYLGPELISTGRCDTRTDIYAVGILLYEMLTGVQPFTGATPIQVAFSHVNSDVPAPSKLLTWLPAELDEFVCALAARDPNDRPTDASAALALLRKLRLGLSAELLEQHGSRAVPAAVSQHSVPMPPTSAETGQDITALLTATSEAPRPSAPPTATSGETDEHATQALWVAAQGSTIALPITPVAPGSRSPETPISAAITAAPQASQEESADAPPKRRIKTVVFWLLATIVLLGGIAAGILWWFSSGPGHFTVVPDGLVSATYDDATAILTQEGLQATKSEAYDDNVAAGIVLSTDPESGLKIAKDGSVDLKVSLGIKQATVPTGLTQIPVTEAQAALETAGFTNVSIGEGEWNTTVAVDIVLSLSVAEGTVLPHNAEIVLVPSKGPEPVTIPSVVDMTLDAATTDLTALDISLTSTEEYSETVDEGKIISQSIAADSPAHRGDSMSVVVSLGRPFVEVPDVVRMPYIDATKVLKDLGLEVKVDFWMGFAGNEVRSQSITAGTKVRTGTVITLKL